VSALVFAQATSGWTSSCVPAVARQKIEAAGNELSVMPTAAFGSFIRQDRDKWSKVIEELGLKQLKT
jgi:hypothetical protein